MLFLELSDFVFLLFLELFEFSLGLVDNLLDLGINHHLLHLESHLGLETETAEFALRLANGLFVILHCWSRLGNTGTGPSFTSFVQKLHDLRLIRKLHCQVVVCVQLVQQIYQVRRFVFVGLVKVTSLGENSTDGLADFIGETTSLGRRRSVTLRESVIVISSITSLEREGLL